jgi:tetratricopeptide (TPR) repeat protein
MAKPGRNDPCPCGSGKKYKRCCLEKDEAAERVLAATSSARPSRQSPGVANLAQRITVIAPDDADVELANLSNAAVDLLHEGKLDEAERQARDLLERFPDVHDGWDRLGMVYEARGDQKQAADCYRKVIDFIRAHPEQYDSEFEAVFHKLVAKLDPSAST